MITLNRPIIGEEEIAAVTEVLRSGRLVQGELVAELERKWLQHVEGRGGNKYLSDHAVACSSGTAALHMALIAAGVGPGAEVITSPFSFVATVNMILAVGARPVFVDIDPVTYNINMKLVARAITQRTKVFLPVHLYGRPMDSEEAHSIFALSTVHRGIEDACQAVGAPVGRIGTTCYSLYATKNITAGEGGMIVTDDPEQAKTLRSLRDHGRIEGRRNEYAAVGLNYRMTDLAAAIALCQLKHLDEWTAGRRRNAARLCEALWPHTASAVIPPERPVDVFGHVYHQFTLRCRSREHRERIITRLGNAGIESAVYYPQALNTLPHVVRAAGYQYCPQAEWAAETVLSIPVHPGLTEADLEHILDAMGHPTIERVLK